MFRHFYFGVTITTDAAIGQQVCKRSVIVNGIANTTNTTVGQQFVCDPFLLLVIKPLTKTPIETSSPLRGLVS